MAKQTSKRQAQPEMIRCENCGELYSATYRCCPFCDERPGRRIDDRGYSARSPLQLAVLIGSLVLILAAADQLAFPTLEVFQNRGLDLVKVKFHSDSS